MEEDFQINKINVVQISPSYFKDLVGGGERYPWELSKALSKHLNITFVVFGNERSSEKVSESLIIEKYPAIVSIPPFLSKTNPFPLTRSFFKKIDEADIVHVHQFNTLISSLSILYARIKNKPVCVTDHGGGLFKISNLIPVIGNSVNLYMLVADYSYKKFYKYNKPYYTIYGGVDTSKFSSKDLKKENEVLFVGKILKIKGIDTLINAVKNFDIHIRIDAKLHDVNYLKYLIKLNGRSQTCFNFNATDDGLVADYNGALVTVLPSLVEIFPLVALESMACGTPVICTNVGGLPELVEDGFDGFIVPPNNSTILMEKIKYFIDNPEESKRMGKNAREKILANFTWDAVARRCIDCYRKLLKETDI